MLLALLGWSHNCHADETSKRQMLISASFLYHFSQFTRWPTPQAVIHYCVFDDPDFAGISQLAYQDKTGIEVININSESNINACQLIYFSKNPAPEFLKKISKLAILSVGAEQGFTELGGIIYLYENDSKLRFYINNTAAIKVGLKLGAQLLQLSKEKP